MAAVSNPTARYEAAIEDLDRNCTQVLDSLVAAIKKGDGAEVEAQAAYVNAITTAAAQTRISFRASLKTIDEIGKRDRAAKIEYLNQLVDFVTRMQDQQIVLISRMIGVAGQVNGQLDKEEQALLRTKAEVTAEKLQSAEGKQRSTEGDRAALEAEIEALQNKLDSVENRVDQHFRQLFPGIPYQMVIKGAINDWKRMQGAPFSLFN